MNEAPNEQPNGQPNEHADDLESVVQEGAEEEVDSYPNTEDELGDAMSEETNDRLEIDKDQSEL